MAFSFDIVQFYLLLFIYLKQIEYDFHCELDNKIHIVQNLKPICNIRLGTDPFGYSKKKCIVSCSNIVWNGYFYHYRG
jgi:hypothetical protein